VPASRDRGLDRLISASARARCPDILYANKSEGTFGYDGGSKGVWVNDSDGARRMIYQVPDMRKLLQEQDAYGRLVHYTMGQGLESMRRRD